MQKVFNHIPIIRLIDKVGKPSTPHNRRLQGRMLELSPETVRVMGNITLNALNNTFPLSPRQKKLLFKREAAARVLASNTSSLIKKRHAIQKGGLLLPILTALPALMSAMSIMRGVANNNS